MDRNRILLNRDKLTPSAKEALSRTMHELEKLIIDKATSIAQTSQKIVTEISLRDIFEAKQILFNDKNESRRVDLKRKRLITLISLTGSLYTIIGIFYYIYQHQGPLLGNNTGLLIAFVGLITVFCSYSYNLFISTIQETGKSVFDNDTKTLQDSLDIMKSWQIIENLGSRLMRQEGYSVEKSKSINEILRFLASNLKEIDYDDLRTLLYLRNKVFHEQYQLSTEEKQSFFSQSQKVIDLIRTLKS